MKKNGHRLLTLAALVGTAAGVIHIANRFIDATSQLKDMLEQPHSRTYDWRFGKIFYTKQGHGTPILLIHDIMNKKNRGAMSLFCIKNLSKTPVIGSAVWLFQHIFKLRCGIYETVSNMNNTCGSSD